MNARKALFLLIVFMIGSALRLAVISRSFATMGSRLSISSALNTSASTVEVSTPVHVRLGRKRWIALHDLRLRQRQRDFLHAQITIGEPLAAPVPRELCRVVPPTPNSQPPNVETSFDTPPPRHSV